MRVVKAYSAVNEWHNPQWETIKQRLLRLLDSEDGFIVMLNKANSENYIQTFVNDDDDKGLYLLETRIPLARWNSDFKHYQLITDDIKRVLNDFKCFFDNKVIDVSDYHDITDELIV